MEKLSYFELAGYTKEESEKLEKLCLENYIPYENMLVTLKNFSKPTSAEKALEEINKLQ